MKLGVYMNYDLVIYKTEGIWALSYGMKFKERKASYY